MTSGAGSGHTHLGKWSLNQGPEAQLRVWLMPATLLVINASSSPAWAAFMSNSCSVTLESCICLADLITLPRIPHLARATPGLSRAVCDSKMVLLPCLLDLASYQREVSRPHLLGCGEGRQTSTEVSPQGRAPWGHTSLLCPALRPRLGEAQTLLALLPLSTAVSHSRRS